MSVTETEYKIGMRQKIKFVWSDLILIALDRAFQMEQNDTNISYIYGLINEGVIVILVMKKYPIFSSLSWLINM